MRVVLLSQFHPEIISGGAERAAYSLFQNLQAHPAVAFAALVAPVGAAEIGHAGRFGSFRARPNELVASLPGIDPFTFESRNVDELSKILSTLVRYLKPDVVHAHHFLSWGVETFEILARLDVRVVLTLHEFMLICNNLGQMLTRAGQLCERASPVDCNRCFPEIASGKFFIRAEVIRHALSRVDRFIAPSRFLAARFVEWGLEAERISVVENSVNASFATARPLRPKHSGDRREVVFGFFGNWTPFKGVDVLLEAYGSLPEALRQKTELRLFGANKHWTGGKFDRRVRRLLLRLGSGVQAHGSYHNEDAPRLMAECDWIVVPSIWWENSPLVMQEAMLAGCRIICSDIGGMREKAEPGVDLTFIAGSATSLAAAMEEATSLPCRSNDAAQRKNRIRFEEEERWKVEQHLLLYGMQGSRKYAGDTAPAA